MKKYSQKEDGITLLSLIVTVIILLIITVISIYSFATKNNQIILNDLDIRVIVQQIKENYELYQIKAIAYSKNYDIEDLNWDGENNPTNTAKIENANVEDEIVYILGDIPKKLKNKLIIKNGILYFYNLSEKEIDWVNKFNIPLYTETSLIEYTEGVLEVGDLEITIDFEGCITINGNSNENKYFIKVTNGIECAYGNNASNILQEWINSPKVLVKAGTKIVHEVEVISGNFIGEQVNVVLRDSTNTAEFNCKLGEKNFKVEGTCLNDIEFSYIYIADRKSVV